ncbi:hypothetical protein [Nocardia heshunensis]
MLKRIAGSALVVGPMLWAGVAVAHADDPEPAPDCVSYTVENGKIFAENQCIGGPDGNIYLKSDIDQCKFLGRSQTWTTIDGKLYRCTPEQNPHPTAGSAG